MAKDKQNNGQSGERPHILQRLLLDLDLQHTAMAIIRNPFRFAGT